MNADDLAKILDELGQRLGPTGERVFALAVQYQITSSLIWAIGSAIGLIAIAVGTVLCARLTIRNWRAAVAKTDKNAYFATDPDMADYVFPWLLGGSAFGIAALVLISVLTSSLVTLANPEYSALRGLIESIK